MKKIDIKEKEMIIDSLSEVKEDNHLIITDGKEEKLAVITMSEYIKFMDLIELDKKIHPFKYGEAEIQVINDENIEISYEEYENIRKQLLDALDKTFKPKLEKLN